MTKAILAGARKGRRGRSSAGKVPVLGLLKYGGRVYMQVIPGASSKTLILIIEDRVMLN